MDFNVLSTTLDHLSTEFTVKNLIKYRMLKNLVKNLLLKNLMLKNLMEKKTLLKDLRIIVNGYGVHLLSRLMLHHRRTCSLLRVLFQIAAIDAHVTESI